MASLWRVKTACFQFLQCYQCDRAVTLEFTPLSLIIIPASLVAGLHRSLISHFCGERCPCFRCSFCRIALLAHSHFFGEQRTLFRFQSRMRTVPFLGFHAGRCLPLCDGGKCQTKCMAGGSDALHAVLQPPSHPNPTPPSRALMAAPSFFT